LKVEYSVDGGWTKWIRYWGFDLTLSKLHFWSPKLQFGLLTLVSFCKSLILLILTKSTHMWQVTHVPHQRVLPYGQWLTRHVSICAKTCWHDMWITCRVCIDLFKINGGQPFARWDKVRAKILLWKLETKITSLSKL
jgi:hypothetical protein